MGRIPQGAGNAAENWDSPFRNLRMLSDGASSSTPYRRDQQID
jgi:hypothetical protein